MGKQTATAKSRYGWRWILVMLGGAAWLSIGCSPQTLSMFMMPFTDNNEKPEFQLFKPDKKITLAIVSNFGGLESHPNAIGANVELAELTAMAMSRRCSDNKHEIVILPDAQVRSQEAKLRQLSGGEPSAIELGKNLKADFVLEVTINSFTLLEKNAFPDMYHGKANAAISLYKIDGKGGQQKVFFKEYARTHPRTGPFDASSTTPTMYRTRLLMVIANDISKMFIAYPPDEKHKAE